MTTQVLEKLAYSIQGAAQVLSVSTSHVRRLIDGGKLSAVRVDRRRLLVTRQEIERLLSSEDLSSK